MGSAELLKMTHSVDGKVMGVRDDVQDVCSKVHDVDHRVQGVDDKLDQANRSLSH
jgi:hypothetical protein